LPFPEDKRCPACHIPWAFCVCSHAPRLSLATRVVVLMHSRENLRSSNTGRLAPLALKHAEVRLHGVRDRPVELEDLDPASTFVLFPGRGAKALTPEYVATMPRPATILVPDGNWTQTTHMLKRLPFLQRLPKIELAGPLPGLNRARRNVFPDRMSTFEAIAQAVGALEGDAVEDVLTDFLRRAVDRKLMLRGKLSADDVHGGLGRGVSGLDQDEKAQVLNS
jgi:DTW domain-containing protein YfiP